MNFDIPRLGEAVVDSPVALRFVSDDQRVLYDSELDAIATALAAGRQPASFELAGPRRRIFFDPAELSCGIVTCGGLCPGLNDVIRAIVFTLFYHYGVSTVWGYRFGYEGLVARRRHEPLSLTPALVDAIHEDGGTILGSSRGPQDVGEMVDTLQQMGVGILFAVGGDGTLRGAQAIAEEIRRRGLRISVIGVPKTIDNDISFVHQSFGFHTAVSQTRTPITGAHWEAKGVRNGVGMVKLMGRHSGFIAAYATLANSDVNFCLVPEVPFTLPGFLDALQRRLERRAHAVVVVAEGAGQDLLRAEQGRDASGNQSLGDVGLFLKDQIQQHFQAAGIEAHLKYIDPSYTVRSMTPRSACCWAATPFTPACPAARPCWSATGVASSHTSRSMPPYRSGNKSAPPAACGTPSWPPPASRHRCKHVFVRTIVLVLSATVLVLLPERSVMAEPTFDHERLDVYRLSIEYVAFSY